MTTASLTPARDICTYHNVDYTFITSLQDAGLIEITLVNETTYIPQTELQKLEKMIRLHHELEINIAGIEAINHLLERMEYIQDEMRSLKNKLRLYEGG